MSMSINERNHCMRENRLNNKLSRSSSGSLIEERYVHLIHRKSLHLYSNQQNEKRNKKGNNISCFSLRKVARQANGTTLRVCLKIIQSKYNGL